MPLQLGDTSTERSQVIVFNPAIAAEVDDAVRRRATLTARGFKVTKESEGSITFDPPERSPYLGVFRILSENGDDRVVWDRRDPKQVKEAFQKFREFVGKGYSAFATTSGGHKGHRIDDFDPGLEEVLLVPRTVPG